MGKHKWKCINPGMYDDLMECENCGKRYMEQADSYARHTAPEDGCEKAPMTDAERIAALEAEVVSLRATEARLKGLLNAIHAGITVLGEGIPFNYDTWEQLESEVDGE